ncbi:HEPN domain-containing protein [Caldivirga sp.]|uniref:HEPN domain-containing protein n=1 Tax=Caldivirga sp. TaxID=2080243 RepID=UPI0025C4377A|nr:HEPN domain-containing protein [Caldivirga sp.]
MREEVYKWLQQAFDDLATAKDMVATGHYYAAAFWAQQSADKALKALALSLGKVLRTHDLSEILNTIHEESGLPIDDVKQDANKLTIHYVVSRYPNAANAIPSRIYSRDDAEDLVRRAEKVIQWVRQNLR